MSHLLFESQHRTRALRHARWLLTRWARRPLPGSQVSLSYPPPSSCLRGLCRDHLPLKGITRFLPLENAARIAAHLRVAVTHQVLVGEDAGRTCRVGTVDE